MVLMELFLYVALVIQVMYWGFWLMGVMKIKEPTPEMGQGISIIIAARNELNNLTKLIPELLLQDYDRFEVLICNDRSSDGSFEFLERQAKVNARIKHIEIKEVPDHIHAKKYALTLGIKAAKFDKLVFTDADCLPNSTLWLASFASNWKENATILLGYSSYLKKKGFLNYFIRFETILTGIEYLAAAILHRPFMGVGRNLAYSKSFFLSKKGFQGFQHVTGGDDDLFVNKHSNRSNTRVILSPGAVTLSTPKATLSEFFTQKTRHFSVGKYYSAKSKFVLGLFTISWILSWALLFTVLFIEGVTTCILAMWLLRLGLLMLTFYVFVSKSGERFNLIGLVLLDFIFVPYYFVTGVKAIVTKKIKWN